MTSVLPGAFMLFTTCCTWTPYCTSAGAQQLARTLSAQRLASFGTARRPEQSRPAPLSLAGIRMGMRRRASARAGTGTTPRHLPHLRELDVLPQRAGDPAAPATGLPPVTSVASEGNPWGDDALPTSGGPSRGAPTPSPRLTARSALTTGGVAATVRTASITTSATTSAAALGPARSSSPAPSRPPSRPPSRHPSPAVGSPLPSLVGTSRSVGALPAPHEGHSASPLPQPRPTSLSVEALASSSLSAVAVPPRPPSALGYLAVPTAAAAAAATDALTSSGETLAAAAGVLRGAAGTPDSSLVGPPTTCAAAATGAEKKTVGAETVQAGQEGGASSSRGVGGAESTASAQREGMAASGGTRRVGGGGERRRSFLGLDTSVGTGGEDTDRSAQRAGRYGLDLENALLIESVASRALGPSSTSLPLPVRFGRIGKEKPTQCGQTQGHHAHEWFALLRESVPLVGAGHEGHVTALPGQSWQGISLSLSLSPTPLPTFRYHLPLHYASPLSIEKARWRVYVRFRMCPVSCGKILYCEWAAPI